MFKGLGQFGDMAKLMKQAQEMQTKMASIQDQLDNMEIWGESGAGLVKVKSNAKGKITGLIIDETILLITGMYDSKDFKPFIWLFNIKEIALLSSNLSI